MDALTPVVEQPRERPSAGTRLDQLEVGRSHGNERHRDVLAGDGGPVPDGEAERGHRDGRLGVQIPDDEREVRERRGGDHTTADGR